MQILVQPILCGLKEMETSKTPNLGIHQKLGPEISQNPMENHVNPEKETDETPGSEVNQEPVGTCQDAMVETDIIPEKQAVPEAGFEVNEEPTETCQEAAAESDVNPEKQTSDPGVIYRCRKCRRMLATQEFVVTHEVGAGGKSFRAGKQSNVNEDGEKTECPCIFVEPMKWMQTGQFSMHDVPLVFRALSRISDVIICSVFYLQWKKDMLRTSSFAWDAKLVWDNSTGLVCSAAVEPG